jgi:hypothetical protein
MAKSGVMLQDSQGNFYFVRPEILGAAKLPKALEKDAKVALKAARRSPGPKFKVVGALGVVRASLGRDEHARKPGGLSRRAARGVAVRVAPASPIVDVPSTIMCPW